MALPTGFLASWAAPVVFGVLTALEIGFVWGSLAAEPIVHDEQAYLFQAKIFASWRWIAPVPPLPEFFEQYQVLVTPVFAGKYPPGHSLMLVPGIWLSLPGLMPVLMAGAAAALLFVLARRYANEWVALVTWLIWSSSPAALRFLPSYLSQSTTILLWLLGWWGLSNWLTRKGVGWLVLFSCCIAWGLATRPFTTAAYAATAGVVVILRCARTRSCRDLALACAAGVFVLGIIPLWCLKTVGSAFTTPYALYSRIYFPYQRPGLGLPRDNQPQRALPPDMVRYAAWFRSIHAAHTLRSLPTDAYKRLMAVALDMWGNARWPLAFFFLFGLFVAPRASLFALLTGVLLFLSHLPFAHPWPWSVYYSELHPVLSFVTAVGLWTAVSKGLNRFWSSRRETPAAQFGRTALVVTILVVITFRPLITLIVWGREYKSLSAAYHRAFRELVNSIPERRSLVFVRYSPNHGFDWNVVANEPDLEEARVWVVWDRGPDNARLSALAPDRTPYLFEESSFELKRLRGTPVRNTNAE